jgi:RNA polymerase sigma factor for flagellar operon FliA
MTTDADFEAHRELVERIVRRLMNELDLACDPEDLRAWGHEGLLAAKQRFDPSRGVRFSTFAYYRVRGAIIDGVRSQGYIKRRAYAKLKALEATDALCEDTAPQANEGASREARAKNIDDALGRICAAYVISAVGQGEDRAPASPEEALDSRQQAVAVRRSLDTLPDKERALVHAVYFAGSTIEQAGAQLGLSKSWASRIHAKALERMRQKLDARDG